jgi:serine/threonine protein kinase
MPADSNRVRDVFLAATDRPAAERPAYLAEACGPDADLRAAVERLLAAHADPASILDPPPEAAGRLPDTGPHTPRPDAGTVLAGRYKLLEQIGEGGMGTVWTALQTEPVKRVVAVKLIKPGMDSKAVLARFEAERQALALMDHPNIARVLDAGETADGRPFFVMELVKGVPITRYCDDRRLTPRERLGLFAPVCQAIQHAHQKGVIHRDLKPSNVLIALYDDQPVPKVIDFGVAKATGQPLTESTLVTGFGTVVGTPEYMSPEQASFNNLDIDTRSDVYSLGVLLYELLTGSPPFTRKELEKAGLLEIFQVIREREPPRPSTRLSTAAALPTLAANRSTEPRKLAGLLRNELDWVVMKALEKDRARRYDTANGFAADVQRYLAGEAVQAVPPSAGYRLRKFVRKNRGPVVAAALVFLALVLAIIGTTSGLVIADRARVAAEAAEKNERHAREQADVARREADDQRKNAERYAIGSAIDLLDQGLDDPQQWRMRWDRKLLRTARLVGTIPPHAEELRQYLVMRLVADLQPNHPIAPEFEGTGGPGAVGAWEVTELTCLPDGRHLVGATRAGEAAVWEAVTHRRVARLREGDEIVPKWGALGIAEGGKLGWTIAKDHTVRVWELPSGRLLLRVAPLAELAGRRANSALAPTVWLGPRHLFIHTSPGPASDPNSVQFAPFMELWDTAGRKRVAAWAGPDNKHEVVSVAFSPDGTLLVTGGADGTATIRRTSDGELIKTLPHAGRIEAIAFTPSGRRAITIAGNQLHWWGTDAWEPLGASDPANPVHVDARFGPPVLVLGENDVALTAILDPGSGQFEDRLYTRGIPSPPVAIPWTREHERLPDWAFAGNRLTDGRSVLDLGTRLVSYPPAASRYHPAAVGVADHGRWLVLRLEIIDLAVQKPIDPFGGPFLESTWSTRKPIRMPSGGYCWCFRQEAGSGDPDHDTSKPCYIPPPSLDVPPDVLELWVQVILRCELGPGDEVRRWDEATWKRKRQDLAARARPTPGFPFPGQIPAGWQQ